MHKQGKVVASIPPGCSICGDVFLDPIQLICKDYFCARCMLGHINKYEPSQKSFDCPQCKKQITKPDFDGPLNVHEIKRWYPLDSTKDIAATDPRAEFCQEEGHSTMQVQLYCRTHESLVCGRCTRPPGVHQRCDIVDIEEQVGLITTNLEKLSATAQQQTRDIHEADSALAQAEEKLLTLKAIAIRDHNKKLTTLREVVSSVEKFNNQTDIVKVIKGRHKERELCKKLLPSFRRVSVTVKDEDSKSIAFSKRCGANAVVEDGQIFAYRKNSDRCFDNGIVMSQVILPLGKLFEVRLIETTMIWETTLGIGVTTSNPQTVSMPEKLYKMPDTWVLWDGDVYYNRRKICEKYAKTSYEKGDRAGVMVTQTKELHFYHNGRDLGIAARGLPDKVYGAVDIWCRAVQVAISLNPDTPHSAAF